MIIYIKFINKGNYYYIIVQLLRKYISFKFKYSFKKATINNLNKIFLLGIKKTNWNLIQRPVLQLRSDWTGLWDGPRTGSGPVFESNFNWFF